LIITLNYDNSISFCDLKSNNPIKILKDFNNYHPI